MHKHTKEYRVQWCINQVSGLEKALLLMHLVLLLNIAKTAPHVRIAGETSALIISLQVRVSFSVNTHR
jgi:hypothetical protein